MAAAISIPDSLARIRRAMQSTLGLITKVVAFLVIALTVGLGTSWYVVNQGAAFNTERVGPWVKWSLTGRLDADPYSLIRHDQETMLVFNSQFVSRYEATFDDEGRRLHSACHYAIEGGWPNSDWWTITVYDGDGRLIPNPANRHGFNSATIVPSTDGRMRIDLARDARPGNWIPTSRAGRLSVIIEYQNRTGDAGISLGANAPVLPGIKRIACR